MSRSSPLRSFDKLTAEDPSRAAPGYDSPTLHTAIRALQSRSQGYIRVIEAAYHEVNSYLNAADAGFLVERKKSH